MNRLKDVSKAIDAQEKVKKKFKVKKIALIILVIIIIIFVVKTSISIHRWQEMALRMVANKSSTVVDTNGDVIAEIGSERNRENIDFEQMPDNLKNAYIAIEDERFYKHFGVDIKRTTAAIFSYITHIGKAKFGASTITQQLVKNLTGDDSTNISRKVKEWAKAIELEWCMSKDEILETYLNIIYVGPNVYGVQKGAEYYFDKNVSDLSLAECAFLAGINNAPNSYNPFNEQKDNSEKIEKRVKTVLIKMLELKNITDDEYNLAISDVESGLKFEKGNVEPESNGVYSYHTDALISEVIADLSMEKKISQTFATNYFYMANVKIYSTQNSDIQKQVQNEFEKSKYKLKSDDGKDSSQAAMVIMDHKTGYVLGCVGGLGEKTEARGFNRATQAIRQTGSSSKPLAVIIPGLDKKMMTPVTKYVDEETTFIDNNNEEYSPKDYNKYQGEITVRRAIESSQNIPFVKMMEQITPEESIKYLRKMGISTLTDKDANLALALGGLDNGISPLEMAGAYSTIANDGVYIEPTFYTKITSQSGEELLKSKQETRKVFDKGVAYVTKELLTQPVVGSKGTAKYCAIPGMEVSAKTGTTNEDYDRWLCGFTNYYTAVTWFGYDLSEPIRYEGKNPAGIIWSNVMIQIHKKLDNSKFEMPNQAVAKEICKESLKLANSGCKDTYTEYFVSGNVPESCNIHKGTVSGNKVKSDTTEKIKNTVKDTVDSVKNELKEDSTTETTTVVPDTTKVTPQQEEPIQNTVQQEITTEPEQPEQNEVFTEDSEEEIDENVLNTEEENDEVENNQI